MSIPTDGPVRAINALQRCINGHSIFDGCHMKPLDASRAGVCTVWGSWHHPGAVLQSDSRWWLTAFALKNRAVRAINALQHFINGHSIFDGCHKKPLDALRAGVCTVWGSWHHPGAVLQSASRWWLTAFALRNGPVRAINTP